MRKAVEALRCETLLVAGGDDIVAFDAVPDRVWNEDAWDGGPEVMVDLVAELMGKFKEADINGIAGQGSLQLRCLSIFCGRSPEAEYPQFALHLLHVLVCSLYRDIPG